MKDDHLSKHSRDERGIRPQEGDRGEPGGQSQGCPGLQGQQGKAVQLRIQPHRHYGQVQKLWLKVTRYRFSQDIAHLLNYDSY